MAETPEQPTHAERVNRGNRNRSLKVLPRDSHEDYPANLGELMEWYTHEVEDVTRAAQLRLRDATKVIADYREGKIDFDEAGKAVDAHIDKWRQIFPGGVEGSIRGKSDEQADQAIEAYWARRDAESRGRG